MAANRTSTTATKTKKKSKTPPIQNESTHQQTPQKNQPNSSSSTPKRTKSPGVRVIGCRIYDSKNGKTCHQVSFHAMCVISYIDSINCANADIEICVFVHQCRQKTMSFVVTCTNQSENMKQCPLNLCQACLLNRYGEDAEEAAASGDWKCPRCRGICNCSFCMMWSNGVLIHTAKKNGYASVSNLLNMKGSSRTKVVNCGAKKKRTASDKFCQEETNTIEDTTEDQNVELQLPPGTELANLVGIDMPLGDIGHALQLLEFCETLERYSETSWIEAFKECIFDTQYPSKELFLELFNSQPNGYDELNFSKKLRLLNFLCDEALGTVKLRLWIEERNVEEKKKAKERLMANRDKEKNIKKKVQDEVAKAILSQNGFPLTISEQKDLVSKVKAETAQTLANSLEMREVLHHESYVVRSEPILLDINGCKLWKLRCLYDKIGILLQDSCYGDVITSDEKWFAYNDQEKALVKEHQRMIIRVLRAVFAILQQFKE
ncbi:hypothetical protein E3N88_42814 [Mikania micrantha]|uniref:Zinc-finger domain-containing protein n=1 Tax=Mikania micrantha TaxID=192012 RepID=A0A5N6LGP4_9ASTR|nr:hypothetical protein E3N88_42814 [Mikania micrantha]